MAKKYKVTLTEEERVFLQGLVKRGKGAVHRLRHAQILLNADANGPARTDADIAAFLGCHTNTVLNVRQRFVEEGFDAALEYKKRATPPILPKLDGEGEARLIAIACSAPPEGRSGWTLKLLGERLVELNVVESISPETVRKALKKTNSSPILGNAGSSRRTSPPTS